MKKKVISVSLILFFLTMLSTVSLFDRKLQAEEYSMPAASAVSEWLEQKQDAASFSSDWLADLDNENYDEAAAVYTIDGDSSESRELLRSMRSGLGDLRSRSYGGAHVTAIANDESEHKVRVIYFTEFAGGTVTESVDVLLWPKAPVILAYKIERE